MSVEAITTLVNAWYASYLAWGRAHPFLNLAIGIAVLLLALRLVVQLGIRLVALAVSLVVAIPVWVATLVAGLLPFCHGQAVTSVAAVAVAWVGVWLGIWAPWQAGTVTAVLGLLLALRIRAHWRHPRAADPQA